ncbi:MAG: EF-hand domain-containing protein, partial [Ardenticatenaceae bacterium]
GQNSHARDIDGDGLAEDANGNGRLDFGDVTALLQHFGSHDAQLDAWAVDFDGDGALSLSDIVALFYKVMY